MTKKIKIRELKHLLMRPSKRTLKILVSGKDTVFEIASPKDAVIEVVSEVTAIELQRMIQTIN